jgi:hypothetical protein
MLKNIIFYVIKNILEFEKKKKKEKRRWGMARVATPN